MADFFQNSPLSRKRFHTAIWTIKLSFLSIGIISTVLLLKLAVPYSLNLLLSTLPRLWSSFRSWLSPPYLYILVNFIIIGIAASSSFQQKLSETKNNKEEENEVENRTQPQKQSDFDSTDSSSQKTPTEIWQENDDIVSEYGDKSTDVSRKSVESSKDIWSDSSCLTDSDDISERKPSISSRFVAIKSTEMHLRVIRSTARSEKPSSPLGVAKPKRSDDSLDATWKAITEGRGEPLTRHLKKSDTWNVPPRVIEPELEPLARRELRKSETFSDTASSTSSGSSRGGGGGGLMREKSLSQDELNRRVEAFIKKVNDEIRLQRQESNQRYMEMINRGVY